MLKEETHAPNETLLSIGLILGGVCFTIMLTLGANFSFDSKLSEYIADKQQSWKIISIPHDSSLDYIAYASRQGGHKLIIRKNQETIYSSKCTNIKEFCLGLQDNSITPVQLDFYARYESTNPTTTYNKLDLKTVHYIDHHQTPKSVDRMLDAPNSPKALEKEKNSFIGFLIRFLPLHALALTLIYVGCTDKDKAEQKLTMRVFNFVAIILVINYIYFIIQYLINT